MAVDPTSTRLACRPGSEPVAEAQTSFATTIATTAHLSMPVAILISGVASAWAIRGDCAEFPSQRRQRRGQKRPRETDRETSSAYLLSIDKVNLRDFIADKDEKDVED